MDEETRQRLIALENKVRQLEAFKARVESANFADPLVTFDGFQYIANIVNKITNKEKRRT